jgi:beta-glucuronidase
MRQVRVKAGLVVAALGCAVPAMAQEAPAVLPLNTVQNGPLLVSADMRQGTDLSGRGIIDRSLSCGDRRFPRRDARAWPAAPCRCRRPKAMAEDNRTLYEFDMAHSPTAALPGSWLAQTPEMRHYQGLVWYQRTFDVPAQRKGRTFLRFGAANTPPRSMSTVSRVGWHEGGFTPLPSM